MNSKNLASITDLRHKLHSCAELSMHEVRTMETLMDFIRTNTSLDIVERDGWFYAKKEGKDPQARIAFRADTDALPIDEGIELPYGSKTEGVSHKCGHDGHSAALCGLALELDQTETEKTIYLIFQPGEETGEGAKLCCRLIGEEDIGEVYAFHNLEGFPEGHVVFRRGLTQPASEGLRLCFEGKTSHASAPEKGNNPAEALSRITLFSLEIADRMRAAADSGELLLCTVTGIRLGSGDFGISPGDGELCLTIRAERESRMMEMEQSILKFAAEVSEQSGLGLTYSIHDGFPETRNDDACLDKVLEAAKACGIPSMEMDHIWRASEDFGHYQKECPGAMFYIGSGADHAPLHTKGYDFNDGILETAADIFTKIALS